MELFTNDSKVFVKLDDQDFVFKMGHQQDLVRYTGDNTVPKQVVKWLEEKGFEVLVEREVHEFHFRGPYDVNEAAEVFGIDIHEDRYERFKGIIDYGISASIEVTPEGKTKITEVEGEELDPPVEL